MMGMPSIDRLAGCELPKNVEWVLGIRKTVAAFAYNLSAAKSLLSTATAAFEYGRRLQAIVDHAAANCAAAGRDDVLAEFSRLKNSPKRSHADAIKLIPTFNNLQLDILSRPGPDQRLRFGEKINTNEANYLENACVKNLLGAYIVSCWTAFEVLAEDLWVSAVNCHPDTLAELKGDMHKLGAKGSKKNKQKIGPLKHPTGKTEDEILQNARNEKLLSLDFVVANHFDLSKIMGTILKGRFTFRKLEGMREAYLRAFSIDYQEVASTILDSSLSELAATRHVLVHKAGIVDEPFLESVASNPMLSAMPNNKKLELTIDLVASFVPQAITKMVALCVSVDKWIKKHPA